MSYAQDLFFGAAESGRIFVVFSGRRLSSADGARRPRPWGSPCGDPAAVFIIYLHFPEGNLLCDRL